MKRLLFLSTIIFLFSCTEETEELERYTAPKWSFSYNIKNDSIYVKSVLIEGINDSTRYMFSVNKKTLQDGRSNEFKYKIQPGDSILVCCSKIFSYIHYKNQDARLDTVKF